MSKAEAWAKNWSSKLKPQRERRIYEYKCPICGFINTRHYNAGRIVCTRCGYEFTPSGWCSRY